MVERQVMRRVEQGARRLGRAGVLGVSLWAVAVVALLGGSQPAAATPPPAPPTGVEAQVLAEETKALRDFVLQSSAFAARMEQYRAYGEHLDALNVLLDAAGPALEVLRDIKEMGVVDILAMAGVLDGGLDVIPQVLAAVDQMHGMTAELATLGVQLKVLTGAVDDLLASERLTTAQLQALRMSAVPTGQQALRAFQGAYQKVAPAFNVLDEAIKELEAQLDDLLGQGLGQLGVGNLPPGLAMGGLGGALGAAGLPSFADLLGPIKALRSELDDMARSAPADIALLDKLAARALDAEAHLAFAQAGELIDGGKAKEGKEMLALMASVYPGNPWADKAQQRIKALDQAAHEQRADAPAGDSPGSTALAAVVTPGGGLSWWAVLVLVIGAASASAAVVYRLQRRAPAAPAPAPVAAAAKRQEVKPADKPADKPRSWERR
jgi:hypothetical protein